MENTQKLFLILENIKLKSSANEDEKLRITNNLKILQKYIKTDIKEIRKESFQDIVSPTIDQFKDKLETLSTPLWDYSCYLFHILLKICNEINFDSTSKEDLISVRQMNDFLNALIDVSKSGIKTNTQMLFNQKSKSIVEQDVEIERLKIGLNFIRKILKNKFLISHNKLQPVITDIMTGIFTLMLIDDKNFNTKEFLEYIWENTSKEEFFRSLLMIKAVAVKDAQDKIHQYLLMKFLDKNGFSSFTRTLILPLKNSNDEQAKIWSAQDSIAKIVVRLAFDQEYFEILISQIFAFIFNCLNNEEEEDLILIGAGVITLQKLISKKNAIFKNIIRKNIGQYLIKLIHPDDILTGAIVMENYEFKILLNFLFTCFCCSSTRSLQSELLVEYLPLFLRLYKQLPSHSPEKGQLKTLIIQCLSNRDKNDILIIIEDLFLLKNQSSYKSLHERIVVRFNEKFNTYSVQIAPPEFEDDFEISIVLSTILKESNNNILIYNVFIAVLQILDYDIQDDISTLRTESKIDLIQTEDELNEFLANKFKSKMSIIQFLIDLITFKQFHSQFHENPREILNIIKNFIDIRLKKSISDTQIDQNLSIVLAIFQEILENSKDTSNYKDFLHLLENYLKNAKNSSMKYQVENLISLIKDGSIKVNEIGQSKYNFAKSLLNEITSPHLMVYGIQELIKLVNDKDEETLANKHAVLALALYALKHEESYTYLNCVRLLVALISVLESEVIETLSAEYLNKDEKIETRLKIGEAILKLTENLGHLAYKYKGILINCFMNGSKQYENNEFRASSLSNLATLCRILSYQVHNFFQELLTLIDSILQTDKYLPSRRAAVMVLSQLLFGMENLIDFQEYLLPVYRYLNLIIENDNDEVTRVHATNGLKALNDKCKEMLFPKQKFEKEIRIFGIKD